MKYVIYTLYREDKEQQRTNPVEEIVSVAGITYNYDTGLMQIASTDFPDVFLPVSHGEYIDVITALKMRDTVEIMGYRGFNELTENSYEYPVQEETLIADNQALILRVKECNATATFAVK